MSLLIIAAVFWTLFHGFSMLNTDWSVLRFAARHGKFSSKSVIRKRTMDFEEPHLFFANCKKVYSLLLNLFDSLLVDILLVDDNVVRIKDY